MNRRQRRARARWRRIALLGPATALALLWTVGMLLPIRRTETVRAEVPAPPEAVFGILTDVDGMPDWRVEIRMVERLPDGAAAMRWRETGPGGRTLALELTEAEPPVRLVVEPAGRSPDRRWVYQLAASGLSGTTLELREERRIINPLHRAVAAVVGFDRGRIVRLARDVERRVSSRRAQVAAGPVR